MSRRKREHGLSICIPNWNHRKFLPRSLHSAICSLRKLSEHDVPGQIIICDDFSRDGSQKAMVAIANANFRVDIKIIISAENEGLASTRNKCIKEADYRFACFMDADNEMNADAAPLFVSNLSETGAAINYGNLIVFEDNRPVDLISNDILRDDIYDGNYIDAFAYVNVDILEHFGSYYGKHSAAHEDWELLLHLIAEEQDVIFTPAIVGNYYVEKMSMIKTTKFDNSKMVRVYNQRGTGLPTAFRRRNMYRSGVGWI